MRKDPPKRENSTKGIHRVRNFFNRNKNILKPEKVRVAISWQGITVEGTWAPNDHEKHASWDLYIELITRISVIELPLDEGILRESLTSLHSIFNKTREILHTYGPEVVRISNEDDMSFGYLAIVVLNYVLRPFLTKWHPRLLEWEDKKDNSVSRLEHERNWVDNRELRNELNLIRVILIEYAELLTKVADVPSLVLKPNISTSDEIPNTTLKDKKLTFFRSGNK